MHRLVACKCLRDLLLPFELLVRHLLDRLEQPLKVLDVVLLLSFFLVWECCVGLLICLEQRREVAQSAVALLVSKRVHNRCRLLLGLETFVWIV